MKRKFENGDEVVFLGNYNTEKYVGVGKVVDIDVESGHPCCFVLFSDVRIRDWIDEDSLGFAFDPDFQDKINDRIK